MENWTFTQRVYHYWNYMVKKNSKDISWQKSYGQRFWLQTCLQWPLPREVTPLDEPVECGDASPMGKAAAMFTARMTLWAWNSWSSNKSVTLLKSLEDIIKVTLVMMTKSFILPNFLKLLKGILFILNAATMTSSMLLLSVMTTDLMLAKFSSQYKTKTYNQISLQWLLQKLSLYWKVSPHWCSNNVLPFSPTIKVSLNIRIPVYFNRILLSD